MNEIAQPFPSPDRASQREAAKHRIFISYASEDFDIANAVHDALKGALDDDFAEIYLDKWSMKAGAAVDAQIRKKLEQTDVFILIFTGTEKESHSYTGMELGYFMRVVDGGRPGRTVPLFLKAPPTTASALHGIGIGFDSKVLNLPPEAFDAQHNNVRPEDPMCAFVGELQNSVDGVRASAGYGPVKLRPDPILCIKTMRQKIFQILRKKPEISLRPQKQVRFTTTDTAFRKSQPNLPADAELEPDPPGSTMSIFGLPDKKITWKNFLSSVSGSEHYDSWRQAITSVISSSFPDKINVDNSQVVISTDGTTSYRIILTACTKYFDDRCEFSLCFVEGLRRKDFGDEDTSRLLKGLDIACRFRSLLLEETSEFSSFSIREAEPGHLPDLAHRLIRELDLLRRDARDAGLHMLHVWKRYVDERSLTEMREEYRPRERALRDIIRQILESQDKPEALAGLQKELASVVLGIETTMRVANSLLVRSMAAKLQQKAAGPGQDTHAPSKGTPDAMGGYSFEKAKPYIGEYVCVRPDFANPRNLYVYEMDIRWSENDGHLIFQEKKRKDPQHTNTGGVYLAESFPFVHLVTITKGMVRQIILSKINDDGVMKGLLQTRYNPNGMNYVPVSAPFVLRKKTDEREFEIGELDETKSDYRAHRQLLEEVEKQGYGKHIGLG